MQRTYFDKLILTCEDEVLNKSKIINSFDKKVTIEKDHCLIHTIS